MLTIPVDYFYEIFLNLLEIILKALLLKMYRPMMGQLFGLMSSVVGCGVAC
jgi:hypothetical protein